jgi:hypothetical protein
LAQDRFIEWSGFFLTGKLDLFEEKGPEWRGGIVEGGIVEVEEQSVDGIICLYGVMQETGGEERHIRGVVNDDFFEGGDFLCLECFDEWLVHI